jgi:hypothetical protein
MQMKMMMDRKSSLLKTLMNHQLTMMMPMMMPMAMKLKPLQIFQVSILKMMMMMTTTSSRTMIHF